MLYNDIIFSHRIGMRPISNDLRQRIVERRQDGESPSEISSILKVSVRSVQRIYSRYLERDNFSPDKKGRPEGSKLDAHREVISKWIEKTPGLTLEELCELCKEQFSEELHHTTMFRALRAWGYRYKKNDLRKGTDPF